MPGARNKEVCLSNEISSPDGNTRSVQGTESQGSLRRLFWLSFLLLFAEILCIRWLGCELIIVRIFPNLIVMTALVSTSAGLIAQSTNKISKLDKSILIAASSFVLLATAIFAVPLSLTKLSIRFESATPITIAIAISLIFLLIACIYVIFRKLGILIGQEFEKHKPLQAYSINLLGSICGTIAIAMTSWLSLGPWVWLLVLVIPLFLITRKPHFIVAAAIFGALSAWTSAGSYWSPYSKLDVIPIKASETTIVGPGNFVLNSNNAYFHTGMRIVSRDREEAFLAQKPVTEQDRTIQHYFRRMKTPFVAAPRCDDVLILGAGSGNDAACALQHGAKHVDAVEIDPIITTFGRTMHPNKPWTDERTRVFNEDARTFLRYTKNKYDLVLFADLDPGATINTSSFLRVDNFVFTQEAMKSALRLCKPEGVVVLSFVTGPENIVTSRLYRTISEASGSAPLAFVDDKWSSCTFVFGPGTHLIDAQKVIATYPDVRIWPVGEVMNTRASSDDWPFLYTNFNVEGMVLYFSVLLVAVVVPALLTILKTPQSSGVSPGQWGNMFFLGQAFMLIETKSITQLSLLFGATWLVSSIVILTILILAWLANLVVMRVGKIPLWLLYSGLFLCLVLDYLWRVPDQTSMPPIMVGTLAALFACCPILFGSMTFSTCFKNTSRPVELLSANLLGVAFGGLTENLCLWFGIKGLPLIGFVLYGLSGLCLFVDHMRRTKQERAEIKTSPVS